MKKVLAGLALLLLVVSIATAQGYAQVPPDGGGGFGGGGFGGEGGPTDPGVQAGNRNTGAPLGSVSTTDGTLQFFQNGLSRFNATDSVSNSPTANNGLGPRFNSNSCVSCHGQPAPGGTGPAVNRNSCLPTAARLWSRRITALHLLSRPMARPGKPGSRSFSTVVAR